MPLGRFLAGAMILSACALPPDPVVTIPAPVAANPEPGVAQPPTPLPAPTEEERIQRAALDSAADAVVLDLLAQAEAPVGETLDAITYDLDVSTWGSHDRVRYYLDFFQGPARERMAIWLDRLPRYEAHIRATLARHGVPGDLVYLALIESGYSNTAVSRSRAVGMWQFMQPTGRMFGLRVDSWVDERRDFIKATDAAARYLADLTRQFGSHFLAAAAYNGGPGRVSRGLGRMGAAAEESVEENGGQPGDAAFFQLSDTRLIHQETKDYVPKLLAATMIAKEPGRYGFTVPTPTESFPSDSLVVPGATGLDVVARLAGVPLGVIRELNPQYLRATTPPGRASVIRLPAGTMESVTTAYADLPAADRVLFRDHEVVRGETLGGIARRYGLTLALLLDANPGMSQRSILRVGQVLRVPGGGGGSGAGATTVSTNGAGASAGSARVHTVAPGETLSGLAVRYRVTVAQLRQWNDLPASGRITVGQRLQVGAGTAGRVATLGSRGGGTPSAGSHVVARGETLTGISVRYGVSVRSLQEANNLGSGTTIRTGQRLRIP